MKKVDVHSDEFQRSMAVSLLQEHKKETRFRSGLTQPMIDELKVRGCGVVLETDHAIYSISSSIPFGHLVTPAEWKRHRLDLLGGCSLFLVCKLGIVAVFCAAGYLRMGTLTGALWFFGWICLCSVGFPDVERRDKLIWAAVGLLFFGAGIVVHLLGWSHFVSGICSFGALCQFKEAAP